MWSVELDHALVDHVCPARASASATSDVGHRAEQRVLLVRLGRDVDLDAVELRRLGARAAEHQLLALDWFWRSSSW